MARAILTALALLTAASAQAADGAAVYTKSCASCHGGAGEGASAKAVAGQSAAFVKEVVEFHPPPMDKMKLPAADVDAVSRYVASLKPARRK
jgi:mono/diheme cytochrome c family protein